MSFYLSVFVCIIISLITAFYHGNFVRYWDKFSSSDDATILAIGILSSRENFEQRDAARSTWLKKYLSGKNNAKAWFIVGNSSCEIPPEYRISMYGCEKLNLNVSGLEENFYTSYESHSEPCSLDQERALYQGFTFKVHFPVVVTRLGVFSRILLENSEIRVAIMDIQSKEIVVQTTIVSNQSTTVHGYIYEKVDEILLPKNYEGLVLIEGYLKDTAYTGIVWNDGGGIITFERVYFTPEHLDSKKHSSNMFAATSIGFFVPEIENLRSDMSKEDLVKNKWDLHLEELNKRLRNEMYENQDILIVDIIDTYRSLPTKLLGFYKWLYYNHEFSYLMKTDDDSVVNIPHLLNKLQAESTFDPERLWIWSRFRKNWPVNYIGKWADYDYRSSYYPSFPCGAAYIMPHAIARWLVHNVKVLHTYQGEDVSLGIWLSAINPEFIEDENFECDSACNLKSYNRAQVSLSQVPEVWSYFEKCQNFCTCDNLSESFETF